MKIEIYAHSFVDLITNSSSESYVCASKGTLETLKKVVNALLAVSKNNSKDTADNLFTFKLVKEASEYAVTEEEWKDYGMNEPYPKKDPPGYYDKIIVTAKDEANTEVAELLTSLQGIFEAREIGNEI